MQDFTSISLFVDDIERMLRDIYGEIDEAAIDAVRWTTFVIIEEFTQFVRKDLWQELSDAQNIDYVWGIGVPDGHHLQRFGRAGEHGVTVARLHHYTVAPFTDSFRHRNHKVKRSHRHTRIKVRRALPKQGARRQKIKTLSRSLAVTLSP